MKVAIEFTTDQQHAIDAKGTILVSAAAGSGKTAVLTERVVTMLADEKNPISADRLLIVTFTNASALEMRVRISKRLDELCAERKGNNYLLKQKVLLKNAKICTIDSYCIELVRSYFATLNINHDFSIAEESQTAAIMDLALDKVLTPRYVEKSSAFNALCLLFGVDKSDKGLSEVVYKIHNYCMCLSQPNKWLDTAADGYFCDSIADSGFAKVVLDYITEVLETSKDTLQYLLREIVGSDIEFAYVDGFTSAIEEICRLIEFAEDTSWDDLYNGVSDFAIPIKTVRNTNDPAFKEVIKGERDAIVKRIKGLASKMVCTEEVVIANLKSAAPTLKELLNIVKEFKEEYFNLLCKQNLLTFSHIEQLALQLLCEEKDGKLVPSKLSKEICRNFDEVLVDEYQDNNNLQDALFFALSDKGKHLFMVGDVKQSIYGFRNANPDNFLKYKDEYPLYDGEKNPCKVVLKQNYRSRKGVCDFVNAFCNTVMMRETCGMDYLEEDTLDAKAKYAELPNVDVKLLLNECNGSHLKREQIDAEEIACYIEETLKKPAFLKNGDNGLRRADYKDFAILLRSPGSRANYYIKALKKKGIPVAFSSGEFYDTPEVVTAVSMLRVIDNPTRDIALLSSMMSVMFGFSPDDMAELRTKYRRGNLYSCVCRAAEGGDERCRYFIETLSFLRMKAATIPVSRLLNEIYNVTSLPEVMSVRPDSKHSRANLIRLMSLASRFDSASNGGVSAFLSEFDRMSSAKKSSGQSAGGNINAVKIMSFHGSKGLQFPICIVADCGGKFNTQDVIGQMILNEKYGIGLKFVDDDDVKNSSVAREAMSILQQRKLIAEEIRLFYVALTRAEEKLVVSLSMKDVDKKIIYASNRLGFFGAQTGKAPAVNVISSSGYFEWVLMTALLQKDGEKLAKYASLNPLPFGGSVRFEDRIFNINNAEKYESSDDDIQYSVGDIGDSPEIEKIADEINRRFEYKYPYEQLCTVPSKVAVTELVHGDSNKYAFTLRPEFMSKSGLTPAERGTAAHKFMQFADYLAAEKDINSEIERLYEWEYISPEEAEVLDSNKLFEFFKSNVYGRIKKAVKVNREYKFMVDYPYGEATTIVQGIADCIFEEEDGIVILDFKTDRVDEAQTLVELYAAQLEVYKYAIEKISGKRVKECILYSLHLSREVSC